MKKRDSAILRFMYHTVPGRIILKAATSRLVSRVCGAYLSCALSKPLIPGFLRKNNIDLSEYEDTKFKSFNDCFTRKIKPNARPIDLSPESLIAPCDGYLSAYKINGNTVIPVKHCRYNIESLLENDKLAEEYEDGICLVFRLCVNNYHRYCYIDNGKKGDNTFIKGKLHTVRPIALETLPVFIRNCREYTVIETENFGKVVQMEVGALMVGKIKNLHAEKEIQRGEEKGMFLFGGSTIILLIKKDIAKIPDVIFDRTEHSEETPVKLGQRVGSSIKGL
ncbi:MAG: phosphatidylserine decarboxylase [Eubacteriales bacterium]|nr:phosphatidylserine decarboxylase [Eubacteriales bacterium]